MKDQAIPAAFLLLYSAGFTSPLFPLPQQYESVAITVATITLFVSLLVLLHGAAMLTWRTVTSLAKAIAWLARWGFIARLILQIATVRRAWIALAVFAVSLRTVQLLAAVEYARRGLYRPLVAVANLEWSDAATQATISLIFLTLTMGGASGLRTVVDTRWEQTLETLPEGALRAASIGSDVSAWLGSAVVVLVVVQSDLDPLTSVLTEVAAGLAAGLAASLIIATAVVSSDDESVSIQKNEPSSQMQESQAPPSRRGANGWRVTTSFTILGAIVGAAVALLARSTFRNR